MDPRKVATNCELYLEQTIKRRGRRDSQTFFSGKFLIKVLDDIYVLDEQIISLRDLINGLEDRVKELEEK